MSASGWKRTMTSGNHWQEPTQSGNPRIAFWLHKADVQTLIICMMERKTEMKQLQLVIAKDSFAVSATNQCYVKDKSIDADYPILTPHSDLPDATFNQIIEVALVSM
jgi:hypothetical protein